MSTQLEGLKAYHRIITDKCRQHRSDEETVDMLLNDMRHYLLDSLQGWRKPKGVKFHIVFTVDRSEIDTHGEATDD